MSALGRSIVTVLAAGAVGLTPPAAPAQHQHGHGHQHGGSPTQAPGSPQGETPPASVRITMHELHMAGGVPPGWRFTLPPGDPAAGRRAFVDLGCFACHAVKGEQFPLKAGETPTGPELTGMGRYHPAEYMAESIVNPSAVVVEGPGWIGGDGRSIMPAYRDLTVGQLIDLVAYLKTLTAPHDPGQHPHHHPPAPAAREQVAGPYRVRLEFRGGEAGHGHGSHGHAHGAQGAAPGATRGQIAAFITLQASGQPVPYLNVQARLEVAGQPPRTLRLGPVLGPDGFHYASDVTLPTPPRRVTVTMGPTSARVLAGGPQGLKDTVHVIFEP